MNVVNWFNNNCMNFYGFNSTPQDNEIESSYISGRKTAVLANTRFLKKITCSLRLKVNLELPSFWTWYTDTLGGKAGGFRCSALGSSVYRFISIPEETDTDRTYRHIKLEIEEVY